MADLTHTQESVCPYCGYPKADHSYFSRTSCVIASLPDDPDDKDETIEVNDGFGI